jgi:hypothetical protein
LNLVAKPQTPKYSSLKKGEWPYLYRIYLEIKEVEEVEIATGSLATCHLSIVVH